MERRADPPQPALRVGLVGYGLAGAVFHGPLIAATPGLEVASIVTADPERRARARRAFPAATVVASPEALWDAADEHDVAVVATPTSTHEALATAAADAGLAVVVDKPLAPTAPAARRMVEHAAAAGTVLTVFFNRRLDAEFLTLRRLVGEGALGTVHRLESRFERWRPVAPAGTWRHDLPPEDGGGVLLDLGVHLVDQARVLLGPVRRVYAEVAARRGGADDDVVVALEHEGGATSLLWASAVTAAPGPRLRVLGSAGAFVVESLDDQEDQLRAGHRPGDDGFGVVGPERWGVLRRGDEGHPVPSERGAWSAFYPALVGALRRGDPLPVDPADAVAAAEVLDAARDSARLGSVVSLA
ncbi:MAG TPA: Gfo/Idh/MocA family oxidoreductase [Acidimicrobiales bacterium]|nr:Gfo/Idh/MocA family oxidoreductase [Acidimicrobiales bacterium]